MSSSYVAGDVGGTNTRLRLVEVSAQGEERVVAFDTFPSKSAASFGDLLDKFLTAHADETVRPAVCAVAVAGPVQDNTCTFTNVSHWPVVDGAQLEERLGFTRVRLINDFGAVGLGVLTLGADDVWCLRDSPCVPRAPIAVIGAGTGLGECFLTHSGTQYDVWPCEGGHADFAPRTAVELDLVRFMARRIAQGRWKDDGTGAHNKEAALDDDDDEDDEEGNVLGTQPPRAKRPVRVSAERIVSGTGLPHIYDFIRGRFPEAGDGKEVDAAVASGDMKKAAAITALTAKCALAQRTVEFFVDAYGSEVGNLALKIMPWGGLYVAGGIAPKIIDALRKGDRFVRALTEKGRMTPLLERVPVYVIKDGVEPGLRGSCVLARRLMHSVDAKLPLSLDPEPANRTFVCSPASRYDHHDTTTRERVREKKE